MKAPMPPPIVVVPEAPAAEEVSARDELAAPAAELVLGIDQAWASASR